MQYQSLLFSKFEQISANVVFATLLLYFGYPRKSIFSSSASNSLKLVEEVTPQIIFLDTKPFVISTDELFQVDAYF